MAVSDPSLLVSEYILLVTDQNCQAVGDPIATWKTLDVTLRWNEPSSGLFTAPAQPYLTGQLLAGNRVVVLRIPAIGSGLPGSVLIAGPIEQILVEKSDDGENGGVGMVTVHFADDMAHIAGRLTYPDPTQTAAGQTTDRWSFTGNAEVALRTLVNMNAGPGALAPRQVPRLVLGALAGVGTNVTVTADRMHPMGDLMRQIAVTGGNIGFRTVQVGNTIEFRVFQPNDKTTGATAVRFGFAYGNLKYIARETTGPSVTTAIVGGQGEGADRNLIERNNEWDEANWGRLETLVSRPGNDPLQSLQDAGDKALGDGLQTVRVASNVADTVDQRYGVHYDIGTKVSIENATGEQISDIVVTVHLQAWPTAGEVVSATIGSQAANPTVPAWVQRLQAIEDRLGTVERAVKPAIKP